MNVIPTVEEVSDLHREVMVKSMLLDLIKEVDPGTMRRGLQLSERSARVAKRMIELDLPPYVVPPFTDDQVKLLREVLSLLVACGRRDATTATTYSCTWAQMSSGWTRRSAATAATRSDRRVRVPTGATSDHAAALYLSSCSAACFPAAC